MDIGSGKGYPASKLSNFPPAPFVFRGVKVTSMEGLLQSWKSSDSAIQIHMCTLIGLQAKAAGRNKNWQKRQVLYWQGKEIGRHSAEYQAMLDEAYEAMFAQNESKRNALLATGNAVLTHSIGRKKASETVLTRSEFCSRLMRIRARLQAQLAQQAQLARR